jgi:transcription termination factor Rho
MAVLKRNELEQSPLADLHALAAELGLEGFRRMRKAELINLLLGDSAGDDDGAEPEEALAEDAAAEGPEPADEDEPAAPRPRRRGGRGRGRPAPAKDEDAEEAGADEEAEAEVRAGILDVLPNGSGFLRADPYQHGDDDVYISPAQIRRCELRAGDKVEGPVRAPRRNERYPSVIRVAKVNGADADDLGERSRFEDMTAGFATAKLTPPPGTDLPAFGKGSRVVVTGPPGAGASTLLLAIAKKLSAARSLSLAVVLAGVRPEELAGWRSELGKTPVLGGSFDQSPDSHADAARMAVELAKRAAERGEDAAIVIDSLDSLPDSAARRTLAAARNTEEGGSITLIAASSEPRAQRLATTRIVLGAGGVVDAEASGTLREDLLK